MSITRRRTLAMGVASGLVATLPLRARAVTIVDDLIADFTGGAEIGEGGITLTAPEIAENGNTVPISVNAPGAAAIMVLAPANPVPPVCTFRFGPLAGSQSASTRIRLAGTQDVIAIARMSDGSFVQTTTTVKVTIGGCGG